MDSALENTFFRPPLDEVCGHWKEKAARFERPFCTSCYVRRTLVCRGAVQSSLV